MRTLYLIDGVAVPKKVWEIRKMFGEYAGARFDVERIPLQGKRAA
jgi:hypothetical protein